VKRHDQVMRAPCPAHHSVGVGLSLHRTISNEPATPFDRSLRVVGGTWDRAGAGTPPSHRTCGGGVPDGAGLGQRTGWLLPRLRHHFE
jgi:hypothetical protein